MFDVERSLPTKPSLALGCGLAICGVAIGSIRNEPFTSSLVQVPILGAALIIVFFSLPTDRGRITSHLAPALGLLVILWCVFEMAGNFPSFPAAHHHPWIGLIGCALILVATWRVAGGALALITLAALLLAMRWHHAPGAVDASALDDALATMTTLWFDPDIGARGWLLDALILPVLPVFLLITLLTDRTEGWSDQAGGLATFSRVTVLPLTVMILVMTVRTDSSLSTAVIALAMPFGLFLAFLGLRRWMSSVPLAPWPGWRDVLPAGSALLVGLAALTAGVSFERSALLALGVVIPFTIFGADGRLRPTLPIRSIGRGGIAFAELLVQAVAVGLVLAVLDRTALPIDLAQPLVSIAGEARLPLIALAVFLSISACLVMPALAAYLIAATLLAPALRTAGVTDLTLHLLVILACLGTSLLRTSMASKTTDGLAVGLPLLGLAFTIAANPALLLVSEALVGVGRPDAMMDPAALAWIVLRVGGMLYLLGTALGNSRAPHPTPVVTILRIMAGLACAMPLPLVHLSGLVLGTLLVLVPIRWKHADLTAA